MNDKIFRTYDEQIELLKNRGVDINGTNIDDAKKYLTDIGYYNLINGYKDLFLETTEPEDKYIKEQPSMIYTRCTILTAD